MVRPKSWRAWYAPQIANMIAEMKKEGLSVKVMKKRLSDANPGQYGWHKKTWASEYMIQLGLSRRKKAKPHDGRGQTKLF